jgi:hypothetical protein
LESQKNGVGPKKGGHPENVRELAYYGLQRLCKWEKRGKNQIAGGHLDG